MVLVILAVGVGTTTTIFSVLDSTLWRRVPFRDAARLVEIWNHVKVPQQFYAPGATRTQILEWRKQADLFDWVEAYEAATLVYRADSNPHLVDGALVTPELFSRLRVSPALGHAFNPGDGHIGTSLKVLLSHTFWEREFRRDRAIVGRNIELDGSRYEVIGVMPAGFRFPDAEAEIWLPISMAAAPPGVTGPERRTAVRMLVPVASLVDPSFERADAAVRSRGVQVNAAAGDGYGTGALLRPFGREATAVTRQTLLLLGGAALLLLLLVCINVAALTVTRDLGRAQSMAVRATLGASRATLVRESMLEHLMTGALAAVVGAGLAVGLQRLLLAIVPVTLTDSTANPVDVDSRVVGFAAASGVFASLLFGLPAALKAASASIMVILLRNGRTATEARWSRHLRTGLVGLQISLSFLLLTGAGLMIRTIHALYTADRGFDPTGLVRVRVGLPQRGYADPARPDQFVIEAVDALQSVPGVESATAGELPPAGAKVLLGPLEVDGSNLSSEDYVTRARLFEVMPTYFETLGIPIRQGSASSRSGSMIPAVISESFARLHWPGASPIGRLFRVGEGEWTIVIGVAADVRYVSPGEHAPEYQVYRVGNRRSDAGVGTAAGSASVLADERTLVVRLAPRGAPGRQALVESVMAIDPAVVVRTDAVHDIVASENARSRMVLLLMGVFATVALLLSALGLYGLLSRMVDQRRKEIGIRIALGAAPAAIGRQVASQALVLTALSLLGGLVLAIASGRVLESELYGVAPFDGITLITVSSLLLGTAAAATWIPARRARRTDPAMLLRSE
jgi:putative ABC transport system permease protein